jgi:CysZ protein
MIRALRLAVSELFEPQLRRVVLLAVGFTVAVFAALWTAIALLLLHTHFFDWWWLDEALAFLGGLAALAVTWFLFPAIVMLFVGLFLDAVVAAIERRHYPHLPPARGVGLGASIASAVRLGLLALALNLLLLPAYLLLPGVNLLLFWGVNGYLLGREYFELVALRRLDPAAARALRRSRGAAVFLAGILIALLLTVPILNLAAPVIGAAFVLHLFETWRSGGVALTNL